MKYLHRRICIFSYIYILVRSVHVAAQEYLNTMNDISTGMYKKDVYNEIESVDAAVERLLNMQVVEKRLCTPVVDALRDVRKVLVDCVLKSRRGTGDKVWLAKNRTTGKYMIIWHDSDGNRHTKSIGDLDKMPLEQARVIKEWFVEYLRQRREARMC